MASNRRDTVTIASGESESTEIASGPHKLVALVIPAAWTAAAITFLTKSPIDDSWVPVYDDEGAEVSVASANVVAGRCIALDAIAGKLAPLLDLKLRSGTAAAPVNQAAAREIGVLQS